MEFTFRESWTLFGLLAETTSDIILKTDLQGCIVQASSGIARLGVRIDPAVTGPHLLDVVSDSARAAVAEALDAALAGAQTGNWVEFPAISPDERDTWYELQARALLDDAGVVYGALAVMRSIDEKRVLKDQLFAATYTDPLTRLTNRAAFISMLEHMIDTQMDGCLAMFSIDFFRTINMKYGQHTGDDVLRVFADLLREMLRSDDLISRIGSERFAVLLPRTSPEQAQAICSRVVATLADLRQTVGESRMAITASGSVARIGDSLDSTIERAELALFFAKAKGRNRLEMEKPRAVQMQPDAALSGSALSHRFQSL
ncbi:GGDEF domain-containing protein [Novosphingobium sp. KA1]|uniref:GGDEF domain-containing protein n=1 Tax=Novosphingobium sp. (strain KA1) TaxID=164608 RepID=UPI001F5C5247|nr:GGDEF domain-containing protein [Novosphingobium sp. KA1]